MRRRDFVTMLGCAAAALPIAVRAQQSAKPRRIGVLMNRAADSSEGQARIAAIQQRLQQLGWSDGQNLLMDVRWGAEDPDQGDPDDRQTEHGELPQLPPLRTNAPEAVRMPGPLVGGTG